MGGGGKEGWSDRLVGQAGRTGCVILLSAAWPVARPAIFNAPQRHVTPGVLRVKVLQGADSAPASSEPMMYAKDLAFDYDLVLTTFSRLSSEWESDYSRMHLGNGGGATGRRLLTQVCVGGGLYGGAVRGGVTGSRLWTRVGGVWMECGQSVGLEGAVQ